MTGAAFDLQGHRGARGRKPENTLPSFEIAIDAGVTSVETDVHLTHDEVPILVHDPHVHEKIFEKIAVAPTVPDPETKPLVRSLLLMQLRSYRANRNPDPVRFPQQNNDVTPLAKQFALKRDMDAFTPPSLADLIDFVAAYAGPEGEKAGKTAAQRKKAGQLLFDLELKRVPFRAEWTSDGFTPGQPGLLERRVVEVVRGAGAVGRCRVRSFDHRSVLAVKELEPALTTAILVAGTALLDPGELACAARADYYCPDFSFLDERQVRQAHERGVRVLPWTCNDPAEWETLLYWGVDGITTDYPDRLAAFLQARAPKV